MAFRRENIKRQFGEAQQQYLEPGERVKAGGFTQAGPSPWLASGIGLLIMYLMGMRAYYIVVTDRRVLFLRASMLSGRPQGLAFADPRSSVSAEDVKPGKIWSKLQYRRADGKPLRLNFHRIWREEFQAVVDALRSPVEPSTAADGSPAIPPPPAPAS